MATLGSKLFKITLSIALSSIGSIALSQSNLGPNFEIPLRLNSGQRDISQTVLITQSGGLSSDGTTDSFHLASKAYYALDLSTKDRQGLVVASGKGTIVAINREAFYPYIIMDHGNGYFTKYQEFVFDSSLHVGQTVETGQQIGKLGFVDRTGTLHGLHWQVEYSADKGVTPVTGASTKNESVLAAVTLEGVPVDQYKLTIRNGVPIPTSISDSQSNYWTKQSAPRSDQNISSPRSLVGQNNSLVVAGSTQQSAIPAPAINANDNISPSGASTALASPNGLGLGYSGALTYSTGTQTADYVYGTAKSQGVANGKLLSWDLSAASLPGRGNVGGASNLADGSAKLSDGSAAYWGRWLGATQITAVSGASVSGNTVFYAGGEAPGTLPQNRVFTYQLASQGAPFGATGCCGSITGGSVTVDTTAKTVAVNNLSFGFVSTSAFGASKFVMNGGGALGTATDGYGMKGSLTGTCSGGLCAAGVASQGAYAGRLIGATGEGIAMAYGAITKTAIGGTTYVGGTGAAVFKR